MMVLVTSACGEGSYEPAYMHDFGRAFASRINKVCTLKKVSKGAKIRNRYNQVPHLTQDTNGKVINLQYESQEVSPFQSGDHKAHINRRT